MKWTVQKLLDWTCDYLKSKGIDSPRLDGEILLAKVLGWERIQLYTQFDRPLVESELQEFKSLLQRRAAREPLAYILGEKEFYSLKFKVGPGVLVPRPETEQIVELGLKYFKDHRRTSRKILDLGTGSGCILISLLVHQEDALGLGVDVNPQALRYAEENAQSHGLNGRIQWRNMDFCQNSLKDLPGPYDLITANLPYIPLSDYSHLQAEVRDYEPEEALVAGPKGLDVFTTLFPQWEFLLRPGGMLLLEMGANQAREVQKLADRFQPNWAGRIWADLAGHGRVMSLMCPVS
jgi:release factor glutamine methyltransferase